MADEPKNLHAVVEIAADTVGFTMRDGLGRLAFVTVPDGAEGPGDYVVVARVSITTKGLNDLYQALDDVLTRNMAMLARPGGDGPH